MLAFTDPAMNCPYLGFHSLSLLCIVICPYLSCHTLTVLCTTHVYADIRLTLQVLSIFWLSFIDPAMHCLYLSCHSLTPLCTVHVYIVIQLTLLCTVHVYVVIHWPCYVLSMFKLSFIDSAMYYPCLRCHSIDYYVLSMFKLSFIDSAMHCPCLSCHALTLRCTVHA